MYQEPFHHSLDQNDGPHTKAPVPSKQIGQGWHKAVAKKTLPPSEGSEDEESADEGSSKSKTEGKPMTKAQAAEKAKARTLTGEDHLKVMAASDG